MNCKEFEKKIPDFIANRLEYKELKAFISHVEECEECKEELTIQFLVAEGMVRLVEGDAFDLKKELDIRMEKVSKGIRRHNAMIYMGVTCGLLALGAVALLVYIFIL